MIFYALQEAKVLIEQWRRHYKTVRPDSALGYRPPAPQTIAPHGGERHIGTTGGPGGANVAFCADCHGAVADLHDSLYFLPPQFRH